ncbi:MAG TPA: hypothetical protein VFE63_18090 [Roseiarcus sp.]|jgi:hypothetical protein|nr:hypothetical protein [Roseiarcus sp.]
MSEGREACAIGDEAKVTRLTADAPPFSLSADSNWRASRAAVLSGEPTIAERGDGNHVGVPFISDYG